MLYDSGKISTHRFGVNTSKMKIVVLTFGRLFVTEEDGSKLKILAFSHDSLRVSYSSSSSSSATANAASSATTSGEGELGGGDGEAGAGARSFHLHINTNAINNNTVSSSSGSGGGSHSLTHPHHHHRSNSGEVFVPYGRLAGISHKSSSSQDSSFNGVGGGGAVMGGAHFLMDGNSNTAASEYAIRVPSGSASVALSSPVVVIKTFCADSEEETRKWVGTRLFASSFQFAHD